MKRYLYTQSFEDEDDPVEFWKSDGQYTVHFKGLTTERKRSGTKCFKLDITIRDGSYVYWSIPVKFPVEGDLSFSAHLLLGKENTGSAGLGLDLEILPVGRSAQEAFTVCQTTKGGWTRIAGDVAKLRTRVTRWLMQRPNWPWPATAENTSAYATRIGLFLYGKPGQRLTVYLDDLRIAGIVLEDAAYRKELTRRWRPVKDQVAAKLASWEQILADCAQQMRALPSPSSATDRLLRAKLQVELDRLGQQMEKMKRAGEIGALEREQTDSRIDQLPVILVNIRQIADLGDRELAVYVVPPISQRKILVNDVLVPGKLSEDLEVSATPGEYEPASFVVSALADLADLRVQATDLRGDSGIIPAAAVDIRVVKCWYQAGTAWVGNAQDKSRHVLVPELLLKDDSLVRVDLKNERNYLKVTRARGETAEKEEYIWISDPDELAHNGHPGRDPRIKDIEELPVADSAVLLPVTIQAGTNKQFWVTVHVPDPAEAGLYTGKISLSAGGRTLADLSLKLRVLPFKLAAPKTFYDLEKTFESSIYYHGKLNPKRPEGSISSEDKSRRQLSAELRNMFAHGVTNPMCNQGYGEELLREYLGLREATGMGGQALYVLSWCRGAVNASSDPKAVERIVALAAASGIPEVYFYGIDEATGEKLTAQRPHWEATHQAGGKVFVAGYATNFDAGMGDIQDLLVCWGAPLASEAAKWHSVGHKIWCYYNPQSGIENPEVYRRNFGLLLWQANYDGAATFSFQAAAGNAWNDFDDPVQRDFMFAYPTVDGVIDTIAWEGYREGIDDIRYATTLSLAIRKAKKSGDREAQGTALAAEKWLNELDTSRDLDAVRQEMIDFILRLENAGEPSSPAW
ncbi:MAG: hypothetical protein KAI66_23835 [Lentisphaeria bacterium]|nr:hypothetical protein [Lentisphaeria bacterium]